MSDVVTRVRGRWVGVLRQLTGLPDTVFNGKHQACPVTGEKGNGSGRFRFANKDGRGNYFCACSDGREDGFGLLKCKMGWGFKEACRAVESVIGQTSYDADAAKTKDRAAAARAITGIMRAAKPAGEHVRAYLASRGIEEVPGSIRQVRTRYGIDRELDAMVVRIRDAAGETLSLHLTYLEDGQKAKIESPRIVMTPRAASVKGGAVRLYPPRAGMIGVAEGIETALSVRALFGVPCWSLISTSGMESFEPPEGVSEVNVFGDLDVKFGGQSAAYRLAHRLATRKTPVPVYLSFPELRPGCGGGMDWNDVLRREKGC